MGKQERRIKGGEWERGGEGLKGGEGKGKGQGQKGREEWGRETLPQTKIYH